MITFKEAYKLPLNRMYSKVFTSDGNMAFDFAFKMLFKDAKETSDEEKKLIIDKLNGKEVDIKFKNLHYKAGIIYDNNEPLY